MNARTLRVVTATCLASLGLLALPTLDSPAGAVAQAAGRVAAWTDAVSQVAVGCFSIGQGDLFLPRFDGCQLETVIPFLSVGPVLPDAASAGSLGMAAAEAGASETEAPRKAAVDHAR